jgi:hypothetical protein
MKPLFIPLKKEFFEAFERGEKSEEFRLYGNRWNEKNCPLGRSVVLSCGYGKSRRLGGFIFNFRKDYSPESLPGWTACYGDKKGPAACIGVCVLVNLSVSSIE